jgi:hypothetical protein
VTGKPRIAIFGRMRSGKSTLAEALAKEFDIPQDNFAAPIHEAWAKLSKEFHWRDSEKREWMQGIAKCATDKDDAHFVKLLEQRNPDFRSTGLVIGDCRRSAEYAWARANDFVTVWLGVSEATQIQRGADKAHLNHPTETAMQGFFNGFDIYFYESDSVEHRVQRIKEYLAEYVTDYKVSFSSEYQDDAVSDVLDERGRQDEKWGPDQEHDFLTWLGILGEEVGEATREALKHKFDEKDKARHRGRFYAEMVQVTAVALNILEQYRRKYMSDDFASLDIEPIKATPEDAAVSRLADEIRKAIDRRVTDALWPKYDTGSYTAPDSIGQLWYDMEYEPPVIYHRSFVSPIGTLKMHFREPGKPTLHVQGTYPERPFVQTADGGEHPLLDGPGRLTATSYRGEKYQINWSGYDATKPAKAGGSDDYGASTPPSRGVAADPCPGCDCPEYRRCTPWSAELNQKWPPGEEPKHISEVPHTVADFQPPKSGSSQPQWVRVSRGY